MNQGISTAEAFAEHVTRFPEVVARALGCTVKNVLQANRQITTILMPYVDVDILFSDFTKEHTKGILPPRTVYKSGI